jgi:CubicO group peptidase (beta-lactamase class C family)
MAPGPQDQHGLGVEAMSGLGNIWAVGHAGSKTGYGSYLVVFPTEQIVVVLLVNNPEFIVEPFVVRLLQAARAS